MSGLNGCLRVYVNIRLLAWTPKSSILRDSSHLWCTKSANALGCSVMSSERWFEKPEHLAGTASDYVLLC